MTLLVISPDYASHLYPLATLATAWRERGERVVVATGSATAGIVDEFGYERVDLRLGRGSNPGVIRAEQQPRGEDDALRGFFAATLEGMVPTLTFQAQARLTDLMWQPVATARTVQEIVSRVAPDHVVVDHLAFSARLALTAAAIPHADVVLGHPSALPVGGEVYGYPAEWPTAFTPDTAALAALRSLCERVSTSFTDEWNGALAQLAPDVVPVSAAFAEHGELLLHNYPAALSSRVHGTHLGSAVRDEPRDAEVDRWLDASDDPFVYVSFGSFLSVRGDVLHRVAAALASLGVRAAIATGSTAPDQLGPRPRGWLVREFLPQVALLRRAAAAVTHGGNNSVTEAMTFGVPLVVLPFSTDQFAGAAAIERAGFGVALAPNTATSADLASAIDGVLALRHPSLVRLATELQSDPGAERAYRAITGSTD